MLIEKHSLLSSFNQTQLKMNRKLAEHFQMLFKEEHNFHMLKKADRISTR